MTLTEREYEILLEALHRFEDDNRRPFASDVNALSKKISRYRDETRRAQNASQLVSTEVSTEVQLAGGPPLPTGENHDQ